VAVKPEVKPAPAAGPVILVSTSYPGANARDVEEAVAFPIEQQIKGVEGLAGIESTSDNDGNYYLEVTFKHGIDRDRAQVLAQNRVSLARRQLPDVVYNQTGVTIRKKSPNNPVPADPNKVAIVVIHSGRRVVWPGDGGWKDLQRAAGAVAKRLEAEHALMKPQVFPVDEKQVSIDVDPVKCQRFGVTRTEVFDALSDSESLAMGHSVKPEVLKKLKKVVVRDKITLGDVAAVAEIHGPAAVFRVDGDPAIRITGAPPAGKSAAAAVAQCVELAEAEMKRLGAQGFAVKNLSAK
jgi:multidrug efflux pump subunit AcrB